MNTLASEIRKLVNLLPPDISSADLPEMIWSIYARFLPDDSKGLSECEDLKPFLNKLSRKRSIRLLYVINQLCEQREKSAFCAGIRMGAKLALEIME